MAKAIASGLLKQGLHQLSASAPSLISGLNEDGVHYFCDNVMAIKNADYIILAVKPKQMAQVLEELYSQLPANACLISVAAGLTLDWFTQYCPINTALIRTMPNLPAEVGLGATPMIANSKVNAGQKQTTALIFSSIGITTWIEREEDMDTFTALSGLGPAYVFLFMQAMIDAAVDLGVNEQIAKLFTLQTIEGSFVLAKKGDLSLNQLITKVTSPKGTTAAALEHLQTALPQLMLKAIRAAKNRAKDLGQTN